MNKLLLLFCSAAFISSHAKSLGGFDGNTFASIQSDGQVFAWGNDYYGQLGVGGSPYNVRSLPIRMFNVTSVTDVSVGHRHVCIIDQDKAKCAGRGSFLGRSSSSRNSNVMVTVEGLDVADDVAWQVFTGHEHSCLLTKDGYVWCWGAKYLGSLANYSIPEYSKAGKADGFGATGNAIDMALGLSYTCVLTSNGEVGCAGIDSQYELNEYENLRDEVLVKVEGLKDVVSIGAGTHHKCAVKRNGKLFCWGYNYYGEFDVEYENWDWSPTRVPGIVGAAQVWCAHGQTYVIMKANGTVMGFGSNEHGAFVFGENTKLHDPIVLYGGQAGVREIRGGHTSTCMLLTTGQVKCIGKATFGQLGKNIVADSSKDLDLVIGLPFVTSQFPTRWPTRFPTRMPTTRYPSKYPTTKFPTRYPAKKTG